MNIPELEALHGIFAEASLKAFASGVIITPEPGEDDILWQHLSRVSDENIPYCQIVWMEFDRAAEHKKGQCDTVGCTKVASDFSNRAACFMALCLAIATLDHHPAGPKYVAMLVDTRTMSGFAAWSVSAEDVQIIDAPVIISDLLNMVAN